MNQKQITTLETGLLWKSTVTQDHVWTVHLSDGLKTGAFFLLAFWLWASSSDTLHETNFEVAAVIRGVANLNHATIE